MKTNKKKQLAPSEIHASEISSNPRGQILEPGFRVIFPENKIASLPGKLMLTEECDAIDRVN